MATEIPGRRVYRGISLLTVCLTVLVLAGVAAAGSDGNLWGGSWELSTWGYSARGVAVWVVGEPGVRLEVMSCDLPLAEAMRALWRQEGQGWTVVTGGGTGVSCPWAGQWSTLDRAESDIVERLAVELPCFLSGQETRRKLVIRRPEPIRGRSAFHSDLAVRGLGQGGAGEILHLVLRTARLDDSPGEHLSLSSSRRPGGVELALFWLGENQGDLPPEFYAPLWPLSEFLEFPTRNPELSRTEGVESSAVLQGGKPAGASP